MLGFLLLAWSWRRQPVQAKTGNCCRCGAKGFKCHAKDCKHYVCYEHQREVDGEKFCPCHERG